MQQVERRCRRRRGEAAVRSPRGASRWRRRRGRSRAAIRSAIARSASGAQARPRERRRSIRVERQPHARAAIASVVRSRSSGVGPATAPAAPTPDTGSARAARINAIRSAVAHRRSRAGSRCCRRRSISGPLQNSSVTASTPRTTARVAARQRARAAASVGGRDLGLEHEAAVARRDGEAEGLRRRRCAAGAHPHRRPARSMSASRRCR